MDVTITLYVEDKSFMLMVEHLKILKDLPLENNYSFQPKDLIFSYEPGPRYNYIVMNIHLDLYLKFVYKLNGLSK